MAGSPFQNRQFLTAVCVAVLAVFVFATLGPGLTVRLFFFGGLAAVGYLLVSRLWRRRPRGRGGKRAPELRILPPPERYRGRSPTTLETLHRALLSAAVGEVTLDGPRLSVTDAEGAVFQLVAQDPDRVVLSEVEVRATRSEVALAACDAMAPYLGPHLFWVDGVELFVDGTVPRGELERQLFEARLLRARQLEAELETPTAPRPDQRWLN